MIKEYNIGGQLRPVRFGFNALSIFGDLTGMTLAQMESMGSGMSFKHLIALVYSGLKDGARKAGQPFNHTVEEVGDWIDEDQSIVASMMNEFAASMVQPTKKKE